MYLSVHHSSFLIFSLIQVLFLDLSSTTLLEDVSVFIACKIEWYKALLDMCVNMMLMANWIKDSLQDVC